MTTFGIRGEGRYYDTFSVSKPASMMERRLKCIVPCAMVVEELATRNRDTTGFASRRTKGLSSVNYNKGYNYDDIAYLPQGHYAYKLRRAARET